MAAAATPVPARRLPAWAQAALGQALALGLALALAALVGGVIIGLYHESPLDVYATIWRFSTERPSDIGRVLENATPLIYSALAVAVVFKAGMFNIGVEGQYLVGMVTAAAAAVTFDSLPAFVLLPLVVLAAMAGSMIWAAIPAVLKVKTGAHEVVTTIMLNGVAISFLAWAILHPLRTTDTGLVDLRTDIFPDAAMFPTIAHTFGLEKQLPESVYLTWLFPLALVACVLVWFLLFRSRLGYEVRAVGSSAGSAQAGGISIGATQIKIFLISGTLAGFVGLNQLLGDKGFLGSNYEAGLGFAGITVAFLGRNHPAGIAVAAVLIGMLKRGQDALALETSIPIEILIILQGVLILSVVIAYEIVNRRIARRRQHEVRAEETALEEAG